MPIISLICSNWPKILKFPVPVHVVFTLYMLICIDILSQAVNIKITT